MKLRFTDKRVELDNGHLDLTVSIKDAICVGDRIIVIHDNMAYPSKRPAPNLVAYNTNGEKLWSAENLTQLSATDAYVEFLSEEPLWVGNYDGFRCRIDLETGKLLESVFTK